MESAIEVGDANLKCVKLVALIDEATETFKSLTFQQRRETRAFQTMRLC